MKPLGILVAFAMCLSSLAAPAPTVPFSQEDARATVAAIHLSFAARLRLSAILQSRFLARAEKDPDPNFAAAAKMLFDATTWGQWNSSSADEFSDEQIADFFAGAQVLLGPFDERGAVFAYWNPFWDALLFARTESDAPVVPDVPTPASANAEPTEREALHIIWFEWISGETFRRETPSAPPAAPRTVVPESDPLSVEIWRVQTATLDRFNAVFPPERASVVSERLNDIGAGATIDRAAEFERIQLRSGTRLALLSLQMKSEEAVGVATRVSDLLRSASVVMLKRHFTDPDHEFFCETFAQLDRRAFRNGFVPYGYVPTAEGALYLFVNSQLPRLYATASLPAGLVDGTTDKPAIFEWYDLEKAPDLLAAWKEEHPAAPVP